MSAGKKVFRSAALSLAEVVVKWLASACERIEIAGSIRRGVDLVGDIELVAIPRFATRKRRDLLGQVGETEYVDFLDERVHELVVAGFLKFHPGGVVNGERYKKLWLPEAEMQVDLFVVRPPAEWGPLLAIRTGPASFSQLLVTKLRERSRRCDQGRVITFEGEAVPCPTEEEFFRACGVPFIAPERRG